MKDYERKLNKELYDAIEKQDFRITDVSEQDGDILIEISQSTPLGEDWSEIIWVKPDDTLADVAYKISKFAECFDIDDAAMPFIENCGRNGIPDSIRDLLEDAEWKKETLTKLGDVLQEKFKERTESIFKSETKEKIERDD